jgi:predicted O-methyltransferase YrrM
MNPEILAKLNLLPGWLSIHEGQFLYKAASLVKNRIGEIVEIGSFQGKSTIYLAKTNQHIYAVDPHEGTLDHGTKISPTLAAFKKHIGEFNVAQNISLIQKTSQSAVYDWNKKIKLIFIDGLHDKKNAEFDYKNWSPFLIDGGIIAMHDSFCGWEGAQKVALKNIILNDDYYEIGVVGSIIYGIKGRVTLFSNINRLRVRCCILLAFWIHSLAIPEALSFLLIHRILKLLLLNRFTVRRN